MLKMETIEMLSTDEVAIIQSRKDSFIISVREKENEAPLENHRILVTHGPLAWSGTIQDFKSIPAIATNALNLISSYGLGEEESTELLCLLRHFGVTPTVPGPQATQHRAKEVAMIAAAIWNNRHEGLLAIQSLGVTDKYDLVATWAGELYDLHADNWEQFDSNWEEMVCAFATDKLRNFQK